MYLGAVIDEPVAAGTVKALQEVTAAQALIPLNQLGRWARAACSVASGGSATEGLFRSPLLKMQVREWARNVRFDAVVAFCSSMVQYSDVPELADVPQILDLVDVDIQKLLDNSAH